MVILAVTIVLNIKVEALSKHYQLKNILIKLENYVSKIPQMISKNLIRGKFN